jgi:hypothetical protein
MKDKKKSFTDTGLALLAILRGIAEHLGAGKSIPFRKGTIDGPGLAALVAPYLATVQAADLQKVLYHNAVAARKAALPDIDQLVADVKKGCDLAFGSDSTEFGTFGFTPPKKAAPLTGEQNQQKAARAKATREARGTVGPKARLKIRGEVPPLHS